MFNEVKAFSGFSVNDMDAARKFYIEKLGCSSREDEIGLTLRFANGHRVFIYEKSDHQPATYTTLDILVDDINSVIDQLTEKGIVMERYENMPAPQDERGVLRGKAAKQGPDIAWMCDPAGNIIAIIEK